MLSFRLYSKNFHLVKFKDIKLHLEYCYNAFFMYLTIKEREGSLFTKKYRKSES